MEDQMKIGKLFTLTLAIALFIGLGSITFASGGGAIVTGDSSKHAAPQYWFGDAEGIEWFPTGKNITYTQADPRINPALTAHSLKMDQGIFKIGKIAYTAHGYGLTSTAFIVGPTGILVIDPPEDVNKGRIALAA
jgi:hypothetical protein